MTTIRYILILALVSSVAFSQVSRVRVRLQVDSSLTLKQKTGGQRPAG